MKRREKVRNCGHCLPAFGFVSQAIDSTGIKARSEIAYAVPFTTVPYGFRHFSHSILKGWRPHDDACRAVFDAPYLARNLRGVWHS